MKKDTSKMLEELEQSFDFKDFHEKNAQYITDTSLKELLDELIEKHNIKKPEAIKRAELSENYGYQIFSGLRIPERKKLLSLGIGMKLSFDEIQELLKCSGYALLYPRNTFDCIVTFGIFKGMSV